MQDFTTPLLGDHFPQIDVLTTHGEMNIPRDLNGSWFVLFSHPADFTPVCTTEFLAFQNLYGEFKNLQCKLLGLSVDQVFSHIKWIEWIKQKLGVKITYPIIAATESVVSKIGLIHPGKGSNTVRATFIIDPEGIVRLMFYYPQEIGRNVEEILRSVKALQTADKQGGATAERWPANELIKDNIIIPPALTEEEAEKNKTKYEHFDWWFCHKPFKQ